MKTDIKQSRMWWGWVENCDRCGKLIRDHSWQSSSEPDVQEADFCVECMQELREHHVSYEDAKQLYLRDNSND